jgi:ankyrin repeat protein
MIVSFLLKNSVSGDAREDASSGGNTALHYASKNGSEAIVCFLIQKGATFENNREGKTPLDVAGNEIVKLILRIEFKGEVVSADICSAVIKSRRVEILVSILKSKFDINSKDSKGKPMLCCAVSTCDRSIVRLILSRSPNLSVTKKNGLTALHIASAKDSADIVKDLISVGSPMHSDAFGHTAIFYAHSDTMKNILHNYETFLSELSSSKDKDSVKKLVKKYKSYVSLYGVQMVFAAMRYQSFNSFKYLITHGVSSNCYDEHLNSPLHLSASLNDVQSTILLLEHGANVNARNDDGATPLHIASALDNDVIMDLLLVNGSDINATAKGRMTPIMGSCRLGCINATLKLKTSGANIQLVNDLGQTALEIASARGFTEIARILQQSN